MRSRLGSFVALGCPVLLAAFLATAATSSAMADSIGNCELTGTKGSMPFTPAQPGQLTVEVNLPDPGWWNGDTPDQIKDGYEYCMAANIAFDTALGAIPVAGDLFDVLYRSNSRNLKIVKKHLDKHHPSTRIIEG